MPSTPRTAGIILLITLATTVGAVQAGGDLIERGSFESGVEGLTTIGKVLVGNDPYEGAHAARLEAMEFQFRVRAD
jgi:hypothetical protein